RPAGGSPRTRARTPLARPDALRVDGPLPDAPVATRPGVVALWCARRRSPRVGEVSLPEWPGLLRTREGRTEVIRVSSLRGLPRPRPGPTRLLRPARPGRAFSRPAPRARQGAGQLRTHRRHPQPRLQLRHPLPEPLDLGLRLGEHLRRSAHRPSFQRLDACADGGRPDRLEPLLADPELFARLVHPAGPG